MSAEAEALLSRSLAILENLYGSNNTWVADVLSWLGDVYAEQERHEEAAPYYQRSLAIMSKVHPENHLSVRGASQAPNLVAADLARGKPRARRFDLGLIPGSFGRVRPVLTVSRYRI